MMRILAGVAGALFLASGVLTATDAAHAWADYLPALREGVTFTDWYWSTVESLPVAHPSGGNLTAALYYGGWLALAGLALTGRPSWRQLWWRALFAVSCLSAPGLWTVLRLAGDDVVDRLDPGLAALLLFGLPGPATAVAGIGLTRLLSRPAAAVAGIALVAATSTVEYSILENLLSEDRLTGYGNGILSGPAGCVAGLALLACIRLPRPRPAAAELHPTVPTRVRAWAVTVGALLVVSGIGVALAGAEMWTPRRPDWWVAGRPISALHVVAWVAFGAAALAISVGPWRRGRPVIVTSSLVCAAGAFVLAALPYLPPVDEGVHAAGIAAALFVGVCALPVAWPAAVWWHRAADADGVCGRGTRLLAWGLALVAVDAGDILAVPSAFIPYDNPAGAALLAAGHRLDGLVGVLAGALVVAAGLRAAHPHRGPAGRSTPAPRTPAVESGGRA